MRPPAALLDQLARTRLMPTALAGGDAIGERRSRRKGQGIEFVDHRPYREGDDTRHLDPHLFARTGDYYLREFVRDQQLPVVVVLDSSPSMAASGEPKARLARALSQTLGFIALAGGDSVRAATADRNAMIVSDRWQGLARSDNLFAWFADHPAEHGHALTTAIKRLARSLTEPSLAIVISDWWDEDLPGAMAAFEEAGHTVLGIQILSAREEDPTSFGNGHLTLIDSESGEERDVVIDDHLLHQYREALETHRARLSSAFRARGWSFVSLTDTEDLADICLRKLRALGVVS